MKVLNFLMLFSIVCFNSTAQIFVKIEGGKMDSMYRNEMEVISCSYGVSTSGVARSGKVSFKDFTFVRDGDKASGSLYLLAASGQHLKRVQVNFYDKSAELSGSKNLLNQITLEDVIITSIETTSACPNCIKLVETISMNYGKITWKDLPSGSSQGWDLKSGKTQ